jgi:diguanylate cyclase (GGDEF)-like protein/PAS domain S-box-containing protein
VGDRPRSEQHDDDAERRLAATAGTLDSIVAASADTVFLMDRDGTIRYLRAQVTGLINLDRGELDDPREETSDREILRWIHRDDRAEVRRVYGEALAAEPGALFGVTHRLRTLGGHWIWVEVRIINQFGLEGVDALVVSSRDVTDRVLAERRLRHRLAAEELLAELAPRFVDVAAADLDDALHEALGQIGRFCGVDRAWILRVDRDGSTVNQTHEWCGDGIETQAHEMCGLRLDDLPEFTSWTNDGDALVVPSVDDMPDEQAAERQLLQLQDIKSMAAHTMRTDGELAGLVGLDAVRSRQRFNRADLWLLKAVSAVFGAALRRCAAERALAASEERFRAMIHNATDGVRLLDAELRLQWASPAVTAITGWTVEDLVDPDRRFALVHPEDRERVSASRAEALLRPGDAVLCAYRCRHADGHWIDLEEVMTNLLDDPAVRGIVANMRDVTADRRHEAELLAQARRDPLTDLPNRRQLDELVDGAVARVARTGSRLAVLYLDLDRFKLVNDSFGHHVGDSLLMEAADRLRTAIRAGDVVARLSGDEFVVLCEPIDGEEEALSIADRVLQAFREPFSVGAGSIYSTASVGVVVSGSPTSDRAGLLRDADAAMYSAKAAGRNRAAVFTGTLVAMARERVQVEVGLREAVPERQLRLRYQPIVSLATGELTGCEALLRWQHPQRGELTPDVFLDVAEETGMIVPIGEWVVHEACRQLASWDSEGLGDHLDLHVNVSVRQLVEGGIAESVQRALVETGIAPSRLCVEITESALLAGDDATRELKSVRACGVRLALDDFGTGHSSLSYLRHLDLDMLKIDRSFVDGVGHDEHDTAIVTAIVRLAESLGLVTVGEGIETFEQRDRLAEIGCTQGQGYWCAPPLEPDGYAALALERRAPAIGESPGQ